MKNALLVVSGGALGLLVALVAASARGGIIPSAEAQAAPAAGNAAAGDEMVLGTAGDHCWVLTKVTMGDGTQHRVLTLYHADPKGFVLKDMRWIDPELHLPAGELMVDSHWSVAKILDDKKYPKKDRDLLLPGKED